MRIEVKNRWFASLAAILGLAACSPEAKVQTGWAGSVDTVGDTVVVTSRNPAVPSLTVDSVRLIWSSEELIRPRVLGLAGDSLLAVLDRERVFVITRNGDFVRMLGRAGAGPGEFRTPRLLASEGDTLYVYDEGLLRLSEFVDAERFSRSWSVPVPAEFPNLAAAGLVVERDSMTAVWTSPLYVKERRPTEAAALRISVAAGSRTLARLTGPTYQMFGEGQVAPAEMFGPRPVFAFGAHGELAWSDGRRYCINSSMPGHAMATRMCREWKPVPILETARHPDLESLPESVRMPAAVKATFSQMFASQQSEGTRNSLDRLLWDSKGQLWVRVIDSAQAPVHPFLIDRYPEVRPPYFLWNVFDGDGRYVREIRLPSGFDLQGVAEDRGYGFAVTASGEPAVGVVDLGN